MGSPVGFEKIWRKCELLDPVKAHCSLPWYLPSSFDSLRSFASTSIACSLPTETVSPFGCPGVFSAPASGAGGSAFSILASKIGPLTLEGSGVPIGVSSPTMNCVGSGSGPEVSNGACLVLDWREE